MILEPPWPPHSSGEHLLTCKSLNVSQVSALLNIIVSAVIIALCENKYVSSILPLLNSSPRAHGSAFSAYLENEVQAVATGPWITFPASSPMSLCSVLLHPSELTFILWTCQTILHYHSLLILVPLPNSLFF